jgi:hypothetical protein
MPEDEFEDAELGDAELEESPPPIPESSEAVGFVGAAVAKAGVDTTAAPRHTVIATAHASGPPIRPEELKPDARTRSPPADHPA